MRLRVWTAAPVIALTLLLPIIACAASSGPGEAASQLAATSEAFAACAPQSIPPAEAIQHIGEEVTVCGLIKDYWYRPVGDKQTLLLFDHVSNQNVKLGIFGSTEIAVPVPFTVFVLGEDKNNFPPNFGAFYSGKTVCATGVIEKLPQGFGRFHEDNPVIVARFSSQLDVDCKAQSANR